MWFILLIVVVAVGYGIYKYLNSGNATNNSPKLTREYLEKMPLKELGDLNVHIGNTIIIYRPVYEKLPESYRKEFGCNTWEELIALNKMIGSIYTERSKNIK